MQARRCVWIDTAPPSRPVDAIVVVDVLRATTTLVTALALGRECHPVPTLEAAWAEALRLSRPLLGGELGGETPVGFEVDNSPSALVARRDRERPLVLLSSSGTGLLDRALREGGGAPVYLGCLRNASALARHLARHHERVALLGAPTRGEFRLEDRLLCARVAAALEDRGFQLADAATSAHVRDFGTAPTDSILASASARWLLRTGRVEDLDFVRRHVDDLHLIARAGAGGIALLTEETHAATIA